jgi:hypothetical protein
MASVPAPQQPAPPSAAIINNYAQDELLVLIESLEPLPPVHSYIASDDSMLMQAITGQLLAILQSSPPYSALTTSLALVVSILIGRTRSIVIAVDDGDGKVQANAAKEVRQAVMQAFITESALGDIFKLFPSLREDLAYNSLQIVPGTEKANIKRTGGFHIGGGRFTTEQSAAVLGMWFRFSHAWPPALTQQKETFLTEIDPCLDIFCFAPGTVSDRAPPTPPALSLCAYELCSRHRIHTVVSAAPLRLTHFLALFVCSSAAFIHTPFLPRTKPHRTCILTGQR